uniref:DnaJ heat shock protein family (Hsp40) member B4 n=1 Tax=Denticeps clupeoides TaxID=299321 RepID=A0AAY4DN97_9TELE
MQHSPRFFGGANPFEMFFGRKVNGRDDDDMEAPSASAVRPDASRTRRSTTSCALSLEEVFHGCTKRMKISRKPPEPRRAAPYAPRTRSSPSTSTRVEGRQPKSRSLGEGDESPNTIPADIVFVIKDKPHPHFRREGSDIIYPVRVSLRSRPLCGRCAVAQSRWSTIDGKTCNMKITDVIKPGMRKTIAGQGTAAAKKPEQRGDLVVELDVNFPESLPTSRLLLISLTSMCSVVTDFH